MEIIYHLILAFIPIFFIGLGAACLYNSDRIYKDNQKQLDAFAKSVRNVSVLHFLTKKRINQLSVIGVWLIKIWGVLALVIGLWCLYSLVK